MIDALGSFLKIKEISIFADFLAKLYTFQQTALFLKSKMQSRYIFFNKVSLLLNKMKHRGNICNNMDTGQHLQVTLVR